MTSAATCGRVFRMIESHIETSQRWKRFDLSALHIRVTDSADRARRIRELLCVTAGARRVVRLARQRRLR